MLIVRIGAILMKLLLLEVAVKDRFHKLCDQAFQFGINSDSVGVISIVDSPHSRLFETMLTFFNGYVEASFSSYNTLITVVIPCFVMVTI